MADPAGSGSKKPRIDLKARLGRRSPPYRAYPRLLYTPERSTADAVMLPPPSTACLQLFRWIPRDCSCHAKGGRGRRFSSGAGEGVDGSGGCRGR